MRAAASQLLIYINDIATLTESQLRDKGMVSCASYVLKNGHVAESQELTPGEWAVVKQAMGRAQFPQKQCWWNARKLWTRSDGALVYTEGYAIGTIIPVQHAWCEINGKVIDPTWQHLEQPPRNGPYKDRTMGLFDPSIAYMGVPIPDLLNYPPPLGGSVIDDWHNGWPLLRLEQPTEIAV